MKRFAAFFLSAIMIFALTGCSANQPQATQVPAATQAPAAPAATDAGSAEAPATTEAGNAEAPAGEAASGSDILIAYFSVPETDGVVGGIHQGHGISGSVGKSAVA